jgi:hypothetical protein
MTQVVTQASVIVGEENGILERVMTHLNELSPLLENHLTSEDGRLQRHYELCQDVASTVARIAADALVQMEAAIGDKADPDSIIWLECHCGWKGSSEEAGYDEYRCPDCGSGSDRLKAYLAPGYGVLTTDPDLVRWAIRVAEVHTKGRDDLSIPRTIPEYATWFEFLAEIQMELAADEVHETERSALGRRARNLRAMARAIHDLGIEPAVLPLAA